MITLAEAARNVGRKVVYTPYAGAPEEGVIAGVSGRWILVRYGTDGNAKATAPGALDFAEPKTDGGAALPVRRDGEPDLAAAPPSPLNGESTSGGEVSKLGGASTSPPPGGAS